MAKTKKTDTPHYEMLFIISNKFSEDEVKPIVEKINALVVANEGAVTYSEDWGKKKLAYPIKGFTYGYYNYVEFDLAGANLAKVERNIRMMSEILRHQIIRREVRTIDMPAKVERPEVKDEKEKPVTKIVEEKIIKKSVKEKTDFKDLDEKLDKILETNDLL